MLENYCFIHICIISIKVMGENIRYAFKVENELLNKINPLLL